MKTVGVGLVEASNMRRNRNSGWTILAAILLGVLALPFALAQEKAAETTIKTTASNVLIDVIVTDRHGRHVPGLKAADFVVYDDGIAQKIDSFTASAGPASDASSSTVNPGKEGIAERAHPQSKPALSSVPRLLTVVLDLADNRPSNTKNSSDAVLRYLDKTATKEDYVAIYYIDKSLHMALPFTNDLGKAVETLKQIETRKSPGSFSGSDRAETQAEIDDLYRQVHPESQLGAIAGDPVSVAGGPGAGLPPTVRAC